MERSFIPEPEPLLRCLDRRISESLEVLACDFPKHRQHSHAFLARALWHQTKRDSPCKAASNRAQHTIVAKYPAMLEAYSEQLPHASRRSLWS